MDRLILTGNGRGYRIVTIRLKCEKDVPVCFFKEVFREMLMDVTSKKDYTMIVTDFEATAEDPEVGYRNIIIELKCDFDTEERTIEDIFYEIMEDVVPEEYYKLTLGEYTEEVA